jgi:hypothetical protein
MGRATVCSVTEAMMRTHHRSLALAFAVLLLAPGPAAAQDQDQARGGVKTETQERQAADNDLGWLWNALGLFGLFGVLGLRKGHDEDSYHPSAID